MTDVPESSVQRKPQGWFINKDLFSDHFLNERLPNWKEWQIQQELIDFRHNLSDLYSSQKRNLPTYNEAQTEEDFIKPVLNLLGYSDSFIVQAATSTGTPDYALFPDKLTAAKAHKKKGEIDYSQCISIADAKYWERDLDATKYSKKDNFTHKNPSFQIISYLTGTQKNWGILTNGRLWRLYYLKSHVPIGNYFQVDIVDLLNASSDKLKYFYLFFRKEALMSDANGKSFLDRVFEGSSDYAVELENNIKDRAYEVVQLICQGFAANVTNKQLDNSELKEIYDNSLIFLYRLLFVFYAEARELLPLSANQSYRDNYSLRSLIHKIEDAQKKNLPFSLKSLNYYQNLTNLFNLIDSGDPDLDVPEYNGGLFDSTEHPFLSQHAISDFYLVKVVHHLAWVIDKEVGYEVMVDYNTLSERHLGSIYEGLLEFKPAIAKEELVEIKEKGKAKYAPAKQYPDKKVIRQKGDLYLVNDKGERKATGSYYTPEYIVNYIVENTLDNLVKEAQLKVKAIKPEVEAEINKWQILKEQKQGLESVEKYDKVIAREHERLLEPYLSLNVLDPAMGSGHFLSRATDYLAGKIASDPSIDSISDLSNEAEITYYRRRVVESCIYGVDLNPLAVELAKLTLWLSTMAKSKPLSFLNHHLRVGNSLIGAKVSDLDELLKVPVKKKKKIDPTRAPVQIGQFEGAFRQKLILLLQKRAFIARIPTETYKDILDKKEWENSFQEDIERFRLLADLWVSQYFGNKVDWGEYNTLALNLQSPKPIWDTLIQKEYAQKALSIRQEKHLFHWELEFPEVFYSDQGIHKENAGFDAIIGNPPYGADFRKDEKDWFSITSVYSHGKPESYIFFMERATNLSSNYCGFIVPEAFLSSYYGTQIRKWLLERSSYRHLISLPGDVFQDATVDTFIFLWEVHITNRKSLNCLVGALGKSTSFRLLLDDSKTWEYKEIVNQGYFGRGIRPISLLNKPVKPQLLRNLEKISKPLSNFADLSQGIIVYKSKTDQSKGYLSLKSQGSDWKKSLGGSDIERYSAEWDRMYIKYGKWLWCPRDPKYFETEKLLFQRIRNPSLKRKLIFAYDNQKLYNRHTLSNLILKPKISVSLFYLLALVNSNLINELYKERFSDVEIRLSNVRSLPIRLINFITPENIRKQQIEKGKGLYFNYLLSHDSYDFLILVDQCLIKKEDNISDIKNEQSDIVHDLLVYLAEEMVRLNKEKQTAIKAFLNWLEQEVIKDPIEEQKNKIKIRSFHESPFEELEKVLKENKKIPDPCPSDIRNTILNEFNKAVNIISPLKSTIMLTDKLIDQVVYKLYGLTEDEIKIIEGKSE